MTQLSAEQEEAMKKVKYPKGWFEPEPNYQPNPFGYYNAYTNPAYKTSYPGQSGGGVDNLHIRDHLDVKGHGANPANQFTSAVTQPRKPWTLDHVPVHSTFAIPTAMEQHGGCACQDGKGIKEIAHKIYRGAKYVHDKAKQHKLVSKGLRAASAFKPGLAKYADAAEKIGYGKKQKGGSVGIIAGDEKYQPRFELQPKRVTRRK